jgi:hypothetical protein
MTRSMGDKIGKKCGVIAEPGNYLFLYNNLEIIEESLKD